MSEAAHHLDTESSPPSIRELVIDWRATWATPKSGPSYFSPSAFLHLRPESQEAEMPEVVNYAHLVKATTEALIAATGVGTQREFINGLSSELNPPGSVPLGDHNELSFMRDVLEMTTVLMSTQEPKS